MSLFEDLFDRSESSGLGGSYTPDGTPAYISVNGSTAVAGDGSHYGYGYFWNTSIPHPSSFDLRFDFSTPSNGSKATYVWISLGRFYVEIYPIADSDPIQFHVAGGRTSSDTGNWGQDFNVYPVALDQLSMYRCRVRQDNVTQMASVRIWKVGTAEPTDWLHQWSVAGSVSQPSFDAQFWMDLEGASSANSWGGYSQQYLDNLVVELPPVDLTAEAVIRRLVFEDTFSRVVSGGLGGTWVWDGQDTSSSLEDSKASVDGSSGLITGPDTWPVYESYTGYPLPQLGELAFDFWVPATPNMDGYEPTYGIVVDSYEYVGLFIFCDVGTTWAVNTWHNSDIDHQFTVTESTWYTVRVRWTDSYINWKIWPRSSEEPALWQVEVPASYWSQRRDPFFDFYYTPNNSEPSKIDNFRVWSYSSKWTNFRVFNAGAVKWSPLVTKSVPASAIIYRPAGWASFPVDAEIAFPGLTANAVVKKAMGAGFPASAVIYRELPPPEQVEISIKLDGVDITDDVLIEEAEFTSQASGSPGTCKFKIKDLTRAYNVRIGADLTLDINGRRAWGGWVTSVSRQFFFPTTIGIISDSGSGRACIVPGSILPRMLVIEGADYNILFRKRYIVRKSNPTNAIVRTWPEDTQDDTIIKWLCDNALYLGGDGLDTDSMVEHVGTPVPDGRGSPVGAGYTWEQAMRAIVRASGAIFYIDPDRRLIHTDVDTPNGWLTLTDDPQSWVEVGYRDMEILYNGSNLINDAMVWGAGQGSSSVAFYRARDQSSINEHGLWQEGEFRTDLWRQSSVQKRAEGFVYGSPQNKRGGKDDAISVAVTVFTPIFRVADKVDFRSTVFGFSDVIPIRRQRMTFPTPSSVKSELVLSHAIDEPWNTFEYWFPPIPKPVIEIDGGDPLCPLPRLPIDPLSGDRFPDMELVFADDFSTRDSGNIPDTTGGQWMTNLWAVRTSMTWTNDAYQVTGSALYLQLANPLSGNTQFILKADFSGWSEQLANSTTSVFEINLGDTADWVVFNLTVLAKLGVNALSINELQTLPFNPRQKVYIRILINRDLGYTAVKIWPQDELEPDAWTHRIYRVPPKVIWKLYIRDAWGTYGVRKVEAIAIWSSPSSSTAYLTSGDELADETYPSPPHWQTPNGGWTRTFDCTENKSGIPTVDGTVSWDVDSLSHSGNGSTSFGSVADYYYQGMKGYINRARASTGYMGFWEYFYPDYTTMPQPDRINISGTISASCNLSTGIASNRVPQNVSVGVELYVVPMASGDTDEAPYFYPYSAQGNVVFTTEISLVTNTSEGTKAVPFNVSLPFKTYVDPFGNDKRMFQVGLRIQNPQLLEALNYTGGPFMMPNTAGLSASLAVASVGVGYEPVYSGTYFCVPSTVLDIDDRVCTTYDVNPDHLRYLYEMGEMWTIDLGSAYVPSSVTVTLDGATAIAGDDFAETSPTDGIVGFLRTMLTVSQVVVCYLPSSVS